MELSYDALREIKLSRVCLFGKFTFCICPCHGVLG